MLDLTQLSAARKPAATVADAVVFDTDTTRFETDVLKASLTQPILVDFWAPWCGPCKQMMPVLEKVVGETGGVVRMAKVNVDASPELAQVFRIQSVPMVYAFFGGQPVDGFVGVKSETEIRAFVQKLQALATPAEGEGLDPDVSTARQQAEEVFAKGDYPGAMALYSTVLDALPDDMPAMAGLGRCLVALREAEGLGELLSQLDDTQRKHDAIKGLVFLHQAALDAAGLPDEAVLQKKIAANPKDHAARFDLARHSLAVLDIESAIDHIIEITRADRDWQNQKARQCLLDIFSALGPAHPLTAQGRRKLSAVLFA